MTKKSKNKSKRGSKHRIAYYEAKWDLKEPKMHSLLVKLVFYLNKSARIIFLTAIRL